MATNSTDSLQGTSRKRIPLTTKVQAPDGVDTEAIKATFNRVEQAMQAMPLSYLRGQVRLTKIRIAIDYASKANEDGLWSAEEINTLLKMTDAAVGYKGKEQ